LLDKYLRYDTLLTTQKRKEYKMLTETRLTGIQKEMKEMGERFTLTQLLVTSMQMIETLPEDQQDSAWYSIMLLIEGARESGVLIAEG
tara:strand:+ start:4850 stop:5113 length:264 start_codon:yes stop_codon:yes gene_type:complete